MPIVALLQSPRIIMDTLKREPGLGRGSSELLVASMTWPIDASRAVHDVKLYVVLSLVHNCAVPILPSVRVPVYMRDMSTFETRGWLDKERKKYLPCHCKCK